MARRSSWPLACDEDEDPADGDEAVLEGGHGQNGELGPVLQREDGKQPPAPGRTTGTGLQENIHSVNNELMTVSTRLEEQLVYLCVMMCVLQVSL